MKIVHLKNLEITLDSEILGAKSLYQEIDKLVKEQLSLPLEEEYDNQYKAYDLLIAKLRENFNNISSSLIIIRLIEDQIGIEYDKSFVLSKIKTSRELYDLMHKFNLKLIDLRHLYSKNGVETIAAIQEFSLSFDIDEDIKDINEIRLSKDYLVKD